MLLEIFIREREMREREREMSKEERDPKERERDPKEIFRGERVEIRKNMTTKNSKIEEQK